MPPIVAIALLVATTIVACCPGPTVIKQPAVIKPVPCLDELPPRVPPETAGDDAWSMYYRAMEGWAALVVRECGGHLLGEADDATGSYGERVR